MERKKLLWKKIGGGSFRLRDGKIIKPNQVFPALESEIPQSFRNLVILLTNNPEEKLEKAGNTFELQKIKEVAEKIVEEVREEEPEVEDDDEYELEVEDDDEYELEVKSPGWWNVIQKVSGKAMNSRALRRNDAVKLLESLIP